jgi:hypothetical protein
MQTPVPPVDKSALSQRLRYLQKIGGDPSIEHVIARLANDAYRAAPQIAARTGRIERRRNIVIYHTLYDMLVDVQAHYRTRSASATVVRMMREAADATPENAPCMDCVRGYLHPKFLEGDQRARAVVCVWTQEEHDLFDHLRYKVIGRQPGHVANPTGNTAAGALEVIIAEATVRAFGTKCAHRA